MALAAGAFAIAELGLRIFPGIIPAILLDEFRAELRQQIEFGQTLFERQGLVDVPRDDGGPVLRVPSPEDVVWRPQHPADRALDAVETIAMDDTGFCNPPTRRWSVEDAEIVALGDSFTWCFAVAPEDAWPAQLERLTGRSTYNLGRGGTGLFEELQILKVYGLPRRPRLVILAVFEGNDVHDALNYWRARRLTEPTGEQPPLSMARDVGGVQREPRADSGWKRLARGTVRALVHQTPLGQSYLVNLGLSAYRAAGNGHRSAESDSRYDVRVNGHVLPFNGANNTYGIALARAIAEGRLSPSLWEPALASFAEISQQAGFRPMVIYTPAAYTAYEGFVAFETDGVGAAVHRFSRTQREWLRDATRRYGLDYLDLTPALQRAAAASPEPLYFPRNQHLTAAGHRAVAAAVAEALHGQARNGKALQAGPASAVAPAMAEGDR